MCDFVNGPLPPCTGVVCQSVSVLMHIQCCTELIATQLGPAKVASNMGAPPCGWVVESEKRYKITPSAARVTHPQSAPRAAHSDQIVDSGCAGYPFPRRGARCSNLQTYPKSAPRSAYSGQIVNSGGAGYPTPSRWGWLEKATLKPTPNQPQVLGIAVKSLIQGVPGTPSPGGWLDKQLRNRSQIGTKCCK
jgi:hypothetical protein